MRVYLAIAIGGIIGCWARYTLGNAVGAIWGRNFPYGTMSINIFGSLLIGFLFIGMTERLAVPEYVRIGVVTGVLGGFTTFSSFSLEIMQLIEQDKIGLGLLYVVLSVGLGLVAAFVGGFGARLLL